MTLDSMPGKSLKRWNLGVLALSQTEIWKLQFIYAANQNRRMEETGEEFCTV